MESFKFKELKTYSKNEFFFDNQRRYRSVFEKSVTDYIRVELSLYNKLFDCKDWNLDVKFKAFDSEHKESICDIDKKISIRKEESIVYIYNAWGSKQIGNYWNRGEYKWEVWIEDTLIATKKFYVEDRGVVTKNHNPYFKVESIKLYKSSKELIQKDKREYNLTFGADETKYINVEMNLINKQFNIYDSYWGCEIFYQIRTELNEIKVFFTSLHLIKKKEKYISVTEGYGNDSSTYWKVGKYHLDIIFMDCLIETVTFEITSLAPEIDNALNDLLKCFKEENLFKEVDELIGLKDIKKELKRYYENQKFYKIREEKGIEDSSKFNLNTVFTGNPGTGKTKVAKLLGNIYKGLGLLTKGHVYEVDRSDLVAEYIGQTAPKTKMAIENARGGILFIDEAYSLIRGKNDSRDFGKEVIEILIKEMTSNDDIAIIFAGYPKEMKILIDSNPGLKSRLKNIYNFPDYTPDELLEIAEYSANKRNVILDNKIKEILHKQFVETYRSRDRTFGNARYVNSIIEEAKANMGFRLVKLPDLENFTKEELSTIQKEDVIKIFQKRISKSPKIPIDESLLKESLLQINNLIGLKNIKTEIYDTIKLVKYCRQHGKDISNVFSLHSIFAGNPGTGKTTFARIISQIYKALGILERGHLVECDRQSLVSGYVGQTAIKTSEIIEEAMGGVLFIDEAYSLVQGSQNDFGNEAIQTLLKKMEDFRGKFGVICAGYTDNMNTFLNSNPGLRSRFDNTFIFEDFNEEELFLIALSILKEYELTPETKAAEHLRTYLKSISDNRDKYFGNAREVRKIILEAIRKQNLRLSDLPKSKVTKKLISTLTYEDVKNFKITKNKSKKVFGFSIDSKE